MGLLLLLLGRLLNQACRHAARHSGDLLDHSLGIGPCQSLRRHVFHMKLDLELKNCFFDLLYREGQTLKFDA